jgi:hypothetical protein
MAGTLLFDEKSTKVLLFVSMDCWILEYFTQEPQSKEQLISLTHFWSTVQRKRSRFEHMQTVIQTSRRLDSFLHELAQDFDLLSNIQDQK